MARSPVAIRIAHDPEHLYPSINVLHHNPPTRQLPIERLLLCRQLATLALLDRYQTPSIMTLNALITTVRQNQHRQTDRQYQQTRLAQRKIVYAAHRLIDIVNQTRKRMDEDLRLDRVPFFYQNTNLFGLLGDD